LRIKAKEKAEPFESRQKRARSEVRAVVRVGTSTLSIDTNR